MMLRLKSSWIVVCGLIFVFNVAEAKILSLTVTACPPWKHGSDESMTRLMLEMCSKDSKRITNGFRDKLGVAESDQVILGQEEATPANMISALEQLKLKTNAGDTLIFFQMTHGGEVPHLYRGYPVNGEVFVYYSHTKPMDFSAAIQDGIWISARGVRNAISSFAKVTGANVLVILETCHAEAAGHSLIHNPIERFEDPKKIAYFFSSGHNQTSTFNDDSSGARFTGEFVKALVNAASGSSLASVFTVARSATHRGNMKYCHTLPKEQFGSVDTYFANCLQEPVFFDPKGLAEDIKVQ